MPRKKATSGFIYVWFDKKHKRYYVGSHWGSPNDGYICSSTWMRNAYKTRPDDFKRRIVAVVTTNKFDLHEEEHRWLQMMKPSELKGARYYNVCNTVKNAWHKYEGTDTYQRLSESATNRWSDEDKRRKQSESLKKAYKEGRHTGTKGKPTPEDRKKKLSESAKKAWSTGVDRPNHKAATQSDEFRKKRSEYMKKLWAERKAKENAQ